MVGLLDPNAARIAQAFSAASGGYASLPSSLPRSFGGQMPYLPVPGAAQAMAPNVSAPRTVGLGARFGNALQDNFGGLTALGAALMAMRKDNRVSFLDVANAGFQGGEYDQKRRDREEKRQQRNATRDYAIKRLGWDEETVQSLDDAGMLGKAVMEGKLPGQEEAGKYGLTPIYGTDANGNPTILQLGEGGTVNQPQLPEGFTPTPGVQRIDLGTAWGIVDRSGNVVSTIPKDVAGERAAQEFGAATGRSQANLPAVEASGDRMLRAIDDLLTDPALSNISGPIQSRLPTYRGDTARAESKLALIQGGTFLQAYNDLRGAGQITEQEGQAAKEAYNRLATTGMNDADFVKALREFRAEVEKLMIIARQRAAGGASSGAPAAPTPAPSGTTPSGLNWSLEP